MAHLPSPAEVLAECKTQRLALRIMAQLYSNLKARTAFMQVHEAVAYLDRLIQHLEHHQ